MTELATGYISLVVETSKIPKQVGDAMKGVEAQADKTGKSMGERLGTGLKRTAAGAGLAAGAALGTAITKGVGRLNSIEQAEAKLSGLGNSAADVGNIMENALASVRGTSYGLDEAATIAASAVAAGVKPGQDLERTLKLTGDAAAIAGVGLSEMGSIVNKVATSDMMQMDVANQMMDAGIPILQMVGQELGVTAEEARKMASAGEVSFETFQNALEQGVGGAALKMGDTAQGAFRNMGAAAGRLGATLAGPFFDQAGGAFTGITGLLDDMTAKAAPAMASLDAWISGSVVPGLTELAGSAREAWAEFAQSDVAVSSVVRLEGLFDRLLDSGLRLAPAVGGIVDSLGRASAAIGISTWEMLLSALEATSVVLDATLVPALELTANLMQDNQGAVTTLVAAYMAFKTVPAIMGRIAPAFTPIVSGAKTAGTSLSDFSGAVRDSYRWMGQANPQMGFMGRSASILGANAGAAAKGGLAAMKTAGSNLLGVFGGPLGAAFTGVTVAVTAGIAAHQKLESSQRALEEASQDLAMAQSDMWSQIGDDAGVADAVVDQIRAISAEMDAAISGEQRGFGAVMSRLGQDMWDGAQFWDSKAWSSDNKAAQDVANELADAANLAKDALDALGMSNDDLAAKITGNAADWEHFRAQLVASGEGGVEAAEKLDVLRAEYERLQAAQEIASPGALELAAAVDVLADSAATGDEKLSALKRALQAIGVLETDAEAAMFDLADAVDKVVESAIEGADAAGGLGDELLNLEGKLDPNVANARALREELSPLRDTILAAAQASGNADEAFAASAPAIEALAEKYRLTTDQVREFLGITPESLNLLVSVDGADEVRQTLTEVALAMKNLPDDEPKVFTTKLDESSAAETIAALEGIGLKVQEIEGRPGMVRITADGEIAVTAMNMIAEQLATLDTSVATPDITADSTIFRLEDETVRASLQILDYAHVDPSVGAIIDDFIRGRDVTMEQLNIIDAKVADPHIKAEISEALQKAQIVNDALDRAARARSATISVVTQNVPGMGLMSGPMALAARAQAGYESGGKLPTTGPGTSIVDGILGVDDNGMAVARVNRGEWVINGDSSDDYNQVLGMINRDDPSVRHLKGYESGGRVSADEVLDFLHARTNDGQSRSLQGAPYDWSGINWGDCSATQAAAWRFATGMSPFGGRFATGNMLESVRSMGGVPGPGGPDDLTSAWYNGGPGGGHTTGHVGGINFEMGGGAGGAGKIGGAAASPFTGSWQHIWHLPLGDRFDWSDQAYTGRRGSGLTIGDYTADAFSGRTNFGARGGSGPAGQSRPTTWSGLAGDAAAQIVGGLTEDALGVFGVPNMLPPALQAWNMLNEPVGDGPTDWDLSVIAARVQQLDAETKVRQTFVDQAQQAIDDVNHSPVGNALPAQMVAAQDQLDAEKRELERVRSEWEAARTSLENALAARAAVLDTADNRGASDRELAETAASEVDDLAKQIEVDHTYDSSRGAEQWTPLIDKLLIEKGLPLSYRGAVVHRMDQESDGNPGAINDWDSNAKAGNPSKGGMQTTQTTFDAFADPGYGDIWRMEDNLRASMNYVTRDPKFRGRTLEDVYRQAGGYFLGGEVTLPPGMQAGVDNVPAWLTVGERVVRNGPSQRYAQEIDAMNSGTFDVRGGTTHFHYQVMSNEEADRHRRNTERQRAAEKVGVR